MSGHTPAPWLIHDEYHGSLDIAITTQKRIDANLRDICEMDIHFGGEHGDEQRANAILIAAAPELLGAAEAALLETAHSLLTQSRDVGDWADDMERIAKLLRAAIADSTQQ